MLRLAKHLVLALFLAGGLLTSSAQACPMCKAAVEKSEESQQEPTAYMASIVTMLSMPAIIFGALGMTLYRMTKREELAVAMNEQASDGEPN